MKSTPATLSTGAAFRLSLAAEFSATPGDGPVLLPRSMKAEGVLGREAGPIFHLAKHSSLGEIKRIHGR
jgi:hypothetical protein